jgi:hypothetical protein
MGILREITTTGYLANDAEILHEAGSYFNTNWLRTKKPRSERGLPYKC